jgi:hypothetical protein
MAAAFPGSEIVAVSNSRTQRPHIEGAARGRGLKNVTVVTADMAEFEVRREKEKKRGSALSTERKQKKKQHAHAANNRAVAAPTKQNNKQPHP